MISCPNLSNKQVAQQFQELVDVVGEVAAYDIWSQNEGNAIDRAPNGAPSKLFADLLEHFNGDRVAAIQAKVKVFSKGFKTWFGDWTSSGANPYSNEIEVTSAQPDYDGADVDGPGVMFMIVKKIGDNLYDPIGSIAVSGTYTETDFIKNKKTEYVEMSSVGNNVSIISEYRNKGYVKAAYFEFAKNIALAGKTLRSASRHNISKDALRVWDSLVRDGYAKNVGLYYEIINENILTSNQSRIVDKNGEPMLLWHGGVGNITEFKPGYKSTETGIYFTSNKGYAMWFYYMYNEPAEMHNAEVEAGIIQDELMPLGDMYPVFLNIRNPKKYTNEVPFQELRPDNQEQDGIIADKVVDLEYIEDHYIVFNPNQIKSATENIGAFDTEDANIYHDIETPSKSKTVDKTVKDRLFNGRNITIVRDLLDNMANTNSELSNLISMINTHTNGFIDHMVIKLYDSDPRFGTNGAAFFDSDKNEIGVRADAMPKNNDDTLDRTILHEIIHAFTTNVLRIDTNRFDEATELLGSVRKALAKKYNMTWEEVVSKDIDVMYGLTNVNEFFSELFANQLFVNELLGISHSKLVSKAKPNSIFGKIITWIASLFGINRVNAYTEGMDMLESIMKRSSGISRVTSYYALNGQRSKLFDSLLKVTDGDVYKAIVLKTKLFSLEFRQWFGDWTNPNDTNVSKAVDENGEPLLLFHYSNEDIQEFIRENDNNYFAKDGGTNRAIFFTREDKPTEGTVLDRKYKIPVFVNIRNPYVLEEKKGYKQKSIEALENGNDGMFMLGINDNQMENQDIYVSFEPSNIKSVYNEGEYSESANIYASLEDISDNQDNSVFNDLADSESSDTTDIAPDKGSFLQLVYDPKNTGAMLPGYQPSNKLADALKSNTFLEECTFEYTVSQYDKPFDIDDVSTWDNAAIYVHLYHKSGKKYVTALRTPSSYNRTFGYKSNQVLDDETNKLVAFRNSIIEASKHGKIAPATINRTNGSINVVHSGGMSVQRPIQDVPAFKIPSNFDMSAVGNRFSIGKGVAGKYTAFTIFGEPVDIVGGSGTSYYNIPAEETPNKKKAVSVKVNLKRFGKSEKGTIEFILKLLTDYKANAVDNVTIDGKELPLSPIDIINLIINFGTQTKVNKYATNPVDIMRYEILKDKQLYIEGDKIYIGEEVFNISDITSDKANTDLYKKAVSLMENMHYNVEKNTIWTKLGAQPELNNLKQWMQRRNINKIDIIPGELSIAIEDFELTQLGWLIKNKTILSDLADNAFADPFIYADGVVNLGAAPAATPAGAVPQKSTTSTGTTPQVQNASIQKALSKLTELYKHLIEGLESRIDTVNRYNTKNLEQISSMQKLLRQLNYDKLINDLTEAEQQMGVIRFVSYLTLDINNATKYINNALLNPNTVNSTQLNQLNTDYIGFYKPMLQEVKRLLDTTDFLNGISIEVDGEIVTKNDLQKYVNSLIVEFTEIGNKYDSLVEIVSANIIKSWGEDTGSSTLKETISQLTSTDKDILYIARYMGMSSQLNDEAIRLIHLTITNAKNEVARNTNRKGQELVSLLEQLPDKKLIQLLYEKDKDGKFTGYLVRDLNYGQYTAEKRAAFDALNKEYGIEKDIDAGKLPEDKRKQYRRKINEWHTKYSERRFIPEYYEAGLELSDATVLARDAIQTEMNIIMSKATNKSGKFNPALLTQAQRNQLKYLVKQKANLSNLYYMDGTIKTGTDLQIAQELKEFNKKVDGNLKYAANIAAFEKEKQLMQATLTPEQYNAWEEFNTRTVYADEFYQLLNSIERSWYGNYYARLKEERDELLKLTKDVNENYNDNTLFSNPYLERIKALDEEMDEIRRKTPTGQKTGLKFSDIAMIVRKPEWAQELQVALKTNDTEWLSRNTIKNPKTGELLPTSAWTYIKPIDAKFIRKEPNRLWSEVSQESAWINKNYDTSDSAEYVQPKRKYYDNRNAYNKAQGNKVLKKIYDKLVETTVESNNKVSFLSHSSSYKIPQISARMMQMLQRKGDLKESLKFLVKDTVAVKNDDKDFINEFAKRPDGSYIKFVPTHFIEMLEDPNMITSDLIGAYIAYYEMADNYKQMNSIAPDVELVIHQLGKRKVTKKVGVKGKTETIEGQASNVFFKAINLADMEIYGKRKDNVEVKLPNSNTRISVTKALTNFTEYVRRVNLFANLPAIFTGFTTAATYSSIESVLGRYYTVKGLNDANKVVLSKLPEVMANLGNPNHKDLLGAMLMYNQVTRSNKDTYKYLDQSKALRALNKHFWYNGYSAGDFIVKSTMLVAIYKDHKLYNGEFISRSQFIMRYYPENKSEGNKKWDTMGETLYDAYRINENGVLTPKKEYEQYIDTRLENKIKNLSNHLAADLDGVLNDSDRAYVHQNAYLQLLFLHRNFMIIGAHKRFKSRQYNHMTQFEEEGMYLTPVRFLFDAFKSGNITNIKALVQMYKDAEPYEQYNIKRTILELSAIMALALIAVPLLNALADEDPDNWFTNEMAYVALRTRFELSTMYNPLELVNMLNSPSAATGTIEQLSGIIKILMIPNWFGDKSAFSEVASGPYEGMPRFMKNAIKSTPVKNLFEVQDPRAKRKYMETQLTF